MTAWVKAGTREEVGVITDYTDDRQVVTLTLLFLVLLMQLTI